MVRGMDEIRMCELTRWFRLTHRDVPGGHSIDHTRALTVIQCLEGCAKLNNRVKKSDRDKIHTPLESTDVTIDRSVA